MPDRAIDHQELFDKVARLETEVTRLREERIPHVDRSSRRRDRRLTLAYVMVTAVVVGFASVGSASALDGSNTVFSDDIVNGNVTGGDLKDGAVGTVDIRDGSLSGVDIANGSIDSADVGLIYADDVAEGAIDGSHIAESSITGSDIHNGTLTGADINLFNDNQCNGETVLGTALINADPAVPSTFTTAWIGYAHSCSGGDVKVRRAAAGQYVVEFGGNPARLAVVTQNTSGGALASAVISVESLAPGYFYVQTRANGTFTDVDFTIMAF